MNWYHLSGQFALAFNSFLSNLCTSRGCLSACHFPKVDGETSLFVEEKKKGSLQFALSSMCICFAENGRKQKTGWFSSV
jgi:CO dehydrogenase/acetyl-CoA synthase beta subunit